MRRVMVGLILQIVLLVSVITGLVFQIRIVGLQRKIVALHKEAAELTPPEVKPEDLHEYDVIHMPAVGHCPSGFEVVLDLFERDGKHYAGCMRPGASPFRGIQSDYLMPRESIHLVVPIDPPAHNGGGKA